MMRTGKHDVLVRADCDAIYKGEPVEIKANTPRWWKKTGFVFQMISNGSHSLFHGVKEYPLLRRVDLYRLSNLGGDLYTDASEREKLQRNILDGMDLLKSQMNE